MFNLSFLNNIQSDFNFNTKTVSLSTDTRSYTDEEVFFCLYGENFDGFDFCEQVLEKGCRIIIFRDNEKNLKKHENLLEKFPDLKAISVKDPILFLQNLAKERIKDLKSKNKLIIGITGSNGKTTTKEMLHSILKSKFDSKVFATKGNLNNHIGVPLTILSAPIDVEVLIVEMGANHVGEIGDLCKIASPEAGIISSIGAAHIGLFGSIENIFKEKSSLYNYVLENKSQRSVFIVNNSDKYLSKITTNEILKNFGPIGSTYETSIDVGSAKISFKDKNLEISNENIQEIYNIENLVSTYLLAINLFPECESQFLSAANNFTMPSLNRSEWIKKESKTFFLDAYNANPTSMSTSLKSFVKNIEKKKISLEDTHFILGDMNELGDYAKDEHIQIAKLLSELGATSVSFVGNYADFYKMGFSSGKVYKEKKDFVDAWPELRNSHQAFFIKASRSLQLESIIDIT